MLGFVKTEKNRNKRGIGGDVFRSKQKIQKIIYFILALIGFIFLNTILYFMTRF